MVRLKTRWLLVRFDFHGDDDNDKSDAGKQSTPTWFPTRRDFCLAVRESLTTCFGSSASDALMDIQIRFDDANSRLLLLRVTRDNYAMIRASITMMTSMPVTRVLNKNTRQQQQAMTARLRVIASVVAVHGSARTAKMGTMKHIRNYYRQQLLQLKQQSTNTTSDSRDRRNEMDRQCRALEETLQRIRDIEHVASSTAANKNE